MGDNLDTQLQFKDFIQEATDFEDIILVKYVAFFASIYLFYNVVPTSTFLQSVKLFFIIVIARYLLYQLTRYKKITEKEDKKYFQIDPTIALVYFMVVLYTRELTSVTTQIKTGMYLGIALYTIFCIGSKSIFTSDAIFTLLFADMIFRNIPKSP